MTAHGRGRVAVAVVQVKALSVKLESAVAAAGTAASEAERLLAAKQEVLARWREEAQMVGGARVASRVRLLNAGWAGLERACVCAPV